MNCARIIVVTANMNKIFGKGKGGNIQANYDLIDISRFGYIDKTKYWSVYLMYFTVTDTDEDFDNNEAQESTENALLNTESINNIESDLECLYSKTEEADVVLVLGHTGAGKSTTIHLDAVHIVFTKMSGKTEEIVQNIFETACDELGKTNNDDDDTCYVKLLAHEIELDSLVLLNPILEDRKDVLNALFGNKQSKKWIEWAGEEYKLFVKKQGKKLIIQQILKRASSISKSLSVNDNGIVHSKLIELQELHRVLQQQETEQANITIVVILKIVQLISKIEMIEVKLLHSTLNNIFKNDLDKPIILKNVFKNIQYESTFDKLFFNRLTPIGQEIENLRKQEIYLIV